MASIGFAWAGRHGAGTLIFSLALSLPPLSAQADDPAALQKALWDAQTLAGSSADKTVYAKRPPCLAAHPDCLKPPPLPEAGPALLPAAAAPPGSIRAVTPRNGEKLLALTFDLCEMAGEQAGYDAALVNYLRQQGVKATFYAGGKWMRSHPEKTLQLLADPLFEIGNHGWSHRNLRRLDDQAARREVLWTQAEYAALRKELQGRAQAAGLPLPDIAEVPPTYRFPFGACSAENLKLLEALKLPAVQWSLVTGDPAPGQSAAAIARAVLGQAKPGAIVVAHANGKGRHTAEALPLFIPLLRQQGYRFVTVSELLRAAERVEAAATCYETKSGDNARYDRLGR